MQDKIPETPAEYLGPQTQPGAPPGTLEADPEAPRPILRIFAYGPEDVHEQVLPGLKSLAEVRKKWPIAWLNVDGLGDAAVIAEIGELFGIHKLTLEDVMQVHQRAKVENYGDYLYIVARMTTLNRTLQTEQFSVIVGRDYVVTFQETVGDCLDPVRERIRKPGHRQRLLKPDYLAYALIDAVIDNYFPILEEYGDRLEELEDASLANPSGQTLAAIHRTKRDLRLLRKTIWPHRDALNALVREPCALVGEETRVYLRDTLDHVIQIIDLVEVQRELGSDLTELYMTNVSNRMNEVMKILTMISTIFIPLSFIAGIYGMNFDRTSSWLNMPELGWTFGYPACLVFMASVTTLLLTFFMRKGWIVLPFGGKPESDEEGP